MESVEVVEFLWVAIALFMGLMFTRIVIALKIDCPDVTVFLIAGIIIGPYFLGHLGIEGLGFTSYESVEKLKIISDAALGFIAFAIGSEFRMSELKKIGKQAGVIGVFQSVLTTIVVDIVLIALHFVLGEEVFPLPAAIIMGAIASATAPAATLMVVRQYKADGPLTKLLLPIVALDDAVGLILFSISLGVAQAIIGGNISVIGVIINPIIEIICSIILGGVFGWILSIVEKLFNSNTNRITISVSVLLFAIALSSLKINIGEIVISFSSLLVCMMLGTVFCNLGERTEDIMLKIQKWAGPLTACFFVLSGAELQLEVFKNFYYVLIGVIYIASRSFGKYFGARVSSIATHCDSNVVKYLGLTLLPQAGVALGMCRESVVLGDVNGVIIRNITLFGVLIYELVGPSITHRALLAAGEINEVPKHKQTKERFEKTKEA